MRMIFGAIGGMEICRGNRSTRRKPTPAPLCPPQNPTWETRSRTQDRSGGKPAANCWLATMSPPIPHDLTAQELHSVTAVSKLLTLVTTLHESQSHILVFPVTVFTALLLQEWSFLCSRVYVLADCRLSHNKTRRSYAVLQQWVLLRLPRLRQGRLSATTSYGSVSQLLAADARLFRLIGLGRSVKLLLDFTGRVIPGYSLLEIHFYVGAMFVVPYFQYKYVGAVTASKSLWTLCHPLSLHYTKQHLYKVCRGFLSMRPPARTISCHSPVITRMCLC
jgi:hypothetical protein